MRIFFHDMTHRANPIGIWLLYIPAMDCYFKVAGFRTKKSGIKTYEMYSKHKTRSDDRETDNPDVFKQWFEQHFTIDPFGLNVPHPPEEITLRRHSNDSMNLIQSLKIATGKDISFCPEYVVRHFNLE